MRNSDNLHNVAVDAIYQSKRKPPQRNPPMLRIKRLTDCWSHAQHRCRAFCLRAKSLTEANPVVLVHLDCSG